jgi:BASS family bile acid:Na+ symporter
VEASSALWIQLAVPVLLLVIMTSMGLELTPADFRRVVEMPRPVVVGLVGQLVLLPCLGIGLAEFAELSPELAVGVVIITACPGGAPSNIFSYLAGANIALSVTLTAFSSVATLFTIPLWVNFGLSHFMGDGQAFALPFGQTLGQLFVIAILPVGLGMLIRWRSPEKADRLRPRLRRAMAFLFAAAVALIVGTQWEVLRRDISVAIPASVALAIIALVVAFASSRATGLDRRDAFTVSIEVGLQNGALASMIAINLLERPDLVVFPGAYALLAFVPVALWTLAYRTVSARSGSSEPTRSA